MVVPIYYKHMLELNNRFMRNIIKLSSGNKMQTITVRYKVILNVKRQ